MRKNLIGLIDACCEAIENPNYRPRADGTTFCNIFVDAVAVKVFGNHDFDGLTADQIYAFCESHADKYTEIQMGEAQDMANQGSFVIAAATATMVNQSDGHVCVIRPGLLKDSGKWGPCPSVCNIGRQNFIGRAPSGPIQGMPAGVNEAFQPMPKFFAWRGSL